MPFFNKMKSMVGLEETHKEVGSTVRVGSFSVKIEKVLAEGGFAVVFLAHDSSQTKYALKKIIAVDRLAASTIENEIRVMQALQKCPQVVKLHAHDKRSAGRLMEHWLLMELCPDGHVVDQMNKRLDTKFSEMEALAIFEAVCLGIQAMHQESPPIAHRDIKPENVLCVGKGYKLCDFGSASSAHITPTKATISDAEDDIGRNTTVQYRAPEQVDLWSGKRIDEKVDIWALGVLLYKILYFEDAFGESTLAIMGAKYKIPPDNKYSSAVVDFMAKMLEVDPDKRLDINETLDTVHVLQGKKAAPSSSAGRASGGGSGGAAASSTPLAASNPFAFATPSATVGKAKAARPPALAALAASNPFAAAPATAPAKTPTPVKPFGSPATGSPFAGQTDPFAGKDPFAVKDPFAGKDPFAAAAGGGAPASHRSASDSAIPPTPKSPLTNPFFRRASGSTLAQISSSSPSPPATETPKSPDTNPFTKLDKSNPFA